MTKIRLLLVTLLALAYPCTTLASASAQPGCPSSCGDLTIPYPFGIGPGCFRDGFEITCKMSNTTTNKKYTATLAGSKVPVLNLSLEAAELQVQLPIGWQSYNESGKEAYYEAEVHFNPKGVYRISNIHNLLVVIGCNTLAYIKSQRDNNGVYSFMYYTGCLSFCNDSSSIIDGSCSGVGCCQITIPSGLTDNLVTFKNYRHGALLSFNPCDYAFLVDKDWFKPSKTKDWVRFGKSNFTMSKDTSMPVWLDWALREKIDCSQAQKNQELYGCRSRNSECYDSVNGSGYLCKCSKGYQGNPYLVNGCADIDECELPDEYPCHGICHNKEASYDCKCESGKHGNPFNNSCTDDFPLRERLAIGISASTVILLVVTLSMILVCQKKQLKREKNEFFKKLQRERETFLEKNEGLILRLKEVETMKVFTVQELKKITYNLTMVIGHGGQGMVYKGRLEGNHEVAVKKCIAVGHDEEMKEDFIKKMIILSQINHENVVRLVGCCLELDVPMLVYENIPKGTLSSFLHGNHELPITLETRLQICSDSAKGLAHLHSKTVLHGDVKPDNILLDNNCRARVFDFGISRFLSMDKTQIATFVQGTLDYLDPEFLLFHQLTKKSDVYSFGVVILELITRKKATYIAEKNESKSLAREFLKAVRENKAKQLFDQDIATPENLELLEKVAEIAEKCLRPTGEERLTMTEVAEQLEKLRTPLQAMRDEASQFYTGSPRPFRDSDGAPLLS